MCLNYIIEAILVKKYVSDINYNVYGLGYMPVLRLQCHKVVVVKKELKIVRCNK